MVESAQKVWKIPRFSWFLVPFPPLDSICVQTEMRLELG